MECYKLIRKTCHQTRQILISNKFATMISFMLLIFCNLSSLLLNNIMIKDKKKVLRHSIKTYGWDKGMYIPFLLKKKKIIHWILTFDSRNIVLFNLRKNTVHVNCFAWVSFFFSNKKIWLEVSNVMHVVWNEILFCHQ